MLKFTESVCFDDLRLNFNADDIGVSSRVEISHSFCRLSYLFPDFYA